VLIATKARFEMGPGPNDAGLSRHHLIEACEASLRRLQTDHIDLYQVHEWDGQTPLEETLGALEHLLQSGKVRYVGCSNFAGWQVMKALRIAERDRGAGVRQPAGVPLLAGALGRVRDRSLGDRPGSRPADLESAGRRPAVGQVPSRRGRTRKGRASRASGMSRRSTTRTSSTTRSRALVAIAEDRGVSPAQVAIAWLLTRPGISTVIIAARTESSSPTISRLRRSS
jgi:aryl-alcohol dehydrogenase-like predicted oxidoreductase